MGVVYAAHQSAIEKKVALKVLKTEFSSRPEVVARFQQEAVSACRIKHPNVVDVFDVGRLEDGRFFLVMELLEGRDLSELLAEAAPLPTVRGIALALQICRALNAAHKSGVIHRDLKPENIFLHRTSDGDEIVKIVDFGIAQLRLPESAPTEERQRKLTTEGTIVGTPEYMAPEQARGDVMDHRVDIYAVGIIMYEMFTGHPPFTGTAMLQILLQQMSEQPPPMAKVNPNLAIAPELEQVIMRALAKRPEERFATMSDLAGAVARAPTASASTHPLTKVRAKQPSHPDIEAPRAAPPSGARDRVRTVDAAVVQTTRRPVSASSPWVTALAVLTVVLFVALAWALFRNNGAHLGLRRRRATSVPCGHDLCGRRGGIRQATRGETPRRRHGGIPGGAPGRPRAGRRPQRALGERRAGRGAVRGAGRRRYEGRRHRPSQGKAGARPGPGSPWGPIPRYGERTPPIEKCFETIGDGRREVPCP